MPTITAAYIISKFYPLGLTNNSTIISTILDAYIVTNLSAFLSSHFPAVLAIKPTIKGPLS